MTGGGTLQSLDQMEPRPGGAEFLGTVYACHVPIPLRFPCLDPKTPSYRTESNLPMGGLLVSDLGKS